MKSNKINITNLQFALVLLTGILLSSCGLQPEEAPLPDMTEIISAAQTQASGTLQAEQANEAALNPTAMEEATAITTFTPLPTIAVSIEPTATFPPMPTVDTPPTAAPQPPPNSGSEGRPCWRAILQSESIADGSVYPPNSDDTKSWTLQNAGSCTWTQDTKLVLIDGAKMFGGFAFDIGNIPVGGISTNQNVRIEVKFITPADKGTYRSIFLLRSYTGVQFGLGDLGAEVFWMEIIVN